MAALAMDYSREPEMARFIDTHKFDQDMSTKRDKFGGGTSLPLNSDGYENKQQQLRDERHIDWMRQQEKESRYISSKQMPHDRVYYRVGTPEQGFPTLGSYEKQRQDQNLVRQKEYNDFLRKQKESEKQKFEARRQAQPTGAPAAGPQIDYDRNNEMAKQEDRKAYQDYMGKYQHPQNASQKPPINYEENRRVLNEERKRDYNQLMEKKAKEERYWAMRGRPVTPPGGLNIGSYERHQKESAEQKKKEYKEMLDQQTAEQLRMKAFERVAEVSPGHINYREDERPLVGSPRDVNYYLHEKEEKRDKFRHDLKAPRKREEYSPESHRNTQYPKADDQNLKAFIDVEREKRENQRQYAEELAQQQREHMYLKARQEPEVAVMDRSGVREQYLASKPPAGPGFRPRDEPTKQNPAFWNDGHRSRGPMSLDSNVPRSNMSSSSKMGTPLAFKTSEPQNRRPIPERPRHGQPPYHGERENDAEKVVYKAVDQVEPQGQEPRQGQGHPPQGQSQRGPGNLYSDEKTRTPPEWLKNDAYSNSLQRPVDSNQSVIGTPLAFKTPYRPIQQHPARPSPLPDNSYSQNQRPIYNELDPTSQRARSRGSPDQGRGSRRSYEAERRPGGQGQEEMNDKSPRRKKQSLYNDNEDVLAKRDKANKERQEEYNEYIKMKQNEERRRQEETRQPVGKPAERVRSPHYSSDDYESWRRKEQQKLGKEYQDYLKEKFQPPPESMGLPIGQYKYEPRRLLMEKERNEEWNQISHRTFREKIPTPPNLQGLPIGQNRYEPMHKAMEYQRNKEYNEFIQKKYGGRTISSRSEPPREKPSDSSFYYGNELEHEEKRKMLDHERRNEYNSFVRERVPPPSKNYNVPTDADSGLPIGQQHHEAWKKFLREQRNKEYNQLVEVKGHDHRNRDWNFEQNGILELRGDDANQSRQRELRAERQKDYNDYKTQMKPAPNHDWPTPNYEKPFITRGAYDGLKELYDEERRKDLQDALERRREHFLPEIKPRVMSEPIRGRYVNQNPMVDALGRYEDYRQKLNADRKQEWMTSLEQARSEEELHDHQEQDKPSIAGDESPLIHSLGKYETEIRQKVKDQRRKDFVDFTHDQPIYTARSTVRENLMPNEASYETPLVSHMGKYDDEREKFREERHEDLLHYSKEHPLTTRSGVHENLMPHEAWAEIPLVSYMGKYDDEKIRFRNERNKDFKLYSEQRRTQLRDPHDHFVFPTVAAAERPIVAHMGRDVEQRKVDLRSERQRDYEQYQQQHKSQSPGRRHDFVDTAQGPYNGGLFQGLGQRGPDKDGLNQQRKHEYNERLDQQYGKERPHGRPNWVKETLPNNVDRGRSPQRNPGPGGADQYSRMLEEKRREEASRRRFDDPEFQGRLPQSRERDNANKQ
ncbi:trichohyalin-like isoform X30 [Mya arenaria]|uniref:trichohyalin-like isoform X30 n=1 Tax=Mya arenaria TaxID=6604 RepID=UPI0022DE9D0C|nr:trichohyalin-like isoform X30 [Mya arenaria]